MKFLVFPTNRPQVALLRSLWYCSKVSTVLSMPKPFCSKPLSIALAGAAGISFLVSNPAKAAPAVSCSNVTTIQKLINAGSCFSRGATVTYSPSFSGFAATDYVSISTFGTGTVATGVANSLTFSVQGNPLPYTSPFSGVLNYSITAPNTRSIQDYTSGLGSSANMGNNRGTFDLTGSAGTAAATYVPNNLSMTQTKTYASTSVLTDAFTASVGVTLGDIQNFTQVFNFQDTTPTPPPVGVPVPGPLPVLGAGIAFGYSRKLRKRIAAA
jgi:hypothetical protein